MILRNNFASSPVKNYSLYVVGCITLTIAGIFFTAFNIFSLSHSYVENSLLDNKIAQQEKQISTVQARQGDLQRRISAIKTPQFVAKTEFINNAIKRRVFSWTKLFDIFERVLPQNVKMISVFPAIANEKININMEVAGKSLKDVLNMVLALENSPAFSSVYFRSERKEEDGMLHATITLQYLPEKAPDVTAVKSDTPPPEKETQEEVEQ